MSNPSRKSRTIPPSANTIEGRENQLIAAAEELAFKKILDGTASSQLLTHYLKLGSVRAKLELEVLSNQNRLLEAKTEAIKSEQIHAGLIEEAIIAMSKYSGQNREAANEY